MDEHFLDQLKRLVALNSLKYFYHINVIKKNILVENK